MRDPAQLLNPLAKLRLDVELTTGSLWFNDIKAARSILEWTSKVEPPPIPDGEDTGAWFDAVTTWTQEHGVIAKLGGPSNNELRMLPGYVEGVPLFRVVLHTNGQCVLEWGKTPLRLAEVCSG